MEPGLILSIVGAALIVALGGIGSAIGVALPGQAAAGVLSEEPEKFGKLLPLVGLPGTQGFYSLLIGFMIILNLGLLTQEIKAPTFSQGLELFGICLFIGLVESVSAIYQGKVAAAGVGMVAKKPEEAGKALVLPIFVEIYAILGLVTGFLLLQGIKF